MSTDTKERITPRDLGKIPRKIAVIVCELVNEYDVTYRIPDGGHLFLYNGKRGTRPYKIAASRPEEYTLPYLYNWIDENVPDWKKETKEVTKKDLEMLAQAVSTSETATYEDERAKSVSEGPFTDADGTEWTEWKYGLLTDGKAYKCAVPGCDYGRPADATNGTRGLHLHQQRAHGTKEEWKARSKKSGATRSMRVAQRKVLIIQAITALAEAHGMIVVERKVDGKIDVKKVEKLQAKLEKVTKERDEAQTRLALMKEALSA